jgi:hypothetical protein
MTRNEALHYITNNKKILERIESDQYFDQYYISIYNQPETHVLTRMQAGLLLSLVPEYIELHFIVDKDTGEVTQVTG